MNILYKLYSKAKYLILELLAHSAPGYLKVWAIFFTIICSSLAGYASETYLISPSPSIPYKQEAQIVRYGEFYQRKADRVPFNRYRQLPTKESDTQSQIEALRDSLPEEFFFPTIRSDNTQFENPSIKQKTSNHRKSAHKRYPLRQPHFSTMPYGDEEPLPSRTEVLPLDQRRSSQVLLLMILSDDWTDSYNYTTHFISNETPLYSQHHYSKLSNPEAEAPSLSLISEPPSIVSYNRLRP
ncbi:MAG: hypothetical protein NZM04_02990 [Methylacidiphilales bacterium]|nr:hypothetical protein [Candidatus Methylacidiphilales bacterium]MDW8348699.1 hypothetical protein [Verrucomicrobiae bacterium]